MSNASTPDELKFQIIREKHQVLPQIMKELGIECWVIFVRESGINPDTIMQLTVGSDMVLPSAFVFGFEDGVFRKIAVVGNFEANEQRNIGIWDEVVEYIQGIKTPLQQVIGRLNPANIALNYSLDTYSADGLSHGLYLILEDILADYKTRFMSAESIIFALRGRKSATELNIIKQACVMTEEINTLMTPELIVGKTEVELQQLYYREMDKRGVIESWARSQCPMIDAGPDKEFGHIGPRKDAPMRAGHTLHNDFGIKFLGYCSDLQRMWFFGSEAELPKELRHAFDTIAQAIRVAADHIKPGKLGYEIDQIARDYLAERGYSEFHHGLGHQVGLEAHDGGGMLGPRWERYGEAPNKPLEVNQVYTLEPSLSTKTYGMVSLEEMVVVTESGCEFLVPPTENFIFIPHK